MAAINRGYFVNITPVIERDVRTGYAKGELKLHSRTQMTLDGVAQSDGMNGSSERASYPSLMA